MNDHRTHNRSDEIERSSPLRADIALRAGLLAFLAVELAAILRPGSWTWGIAYPASLPAPLWGALLALAALATLPPISRRVWEASARVLRSRPAAQVRALHPGWTLVVLALLFALFYAGSIKSYYLGDAAIRRYQLLTTGAIDSRAPLDSWLFGAVPILLAQLTGITRTAGIQVVTASLGLVYAAAVLAIAGHLTTDPQRRLWIALAVGGSTPVMIYFGHPEVYAAVVAIAAVILALLAHRNAGAPLAAAALLWLLLLLVHPAAVLLAPALVYATVRRAGWGGWASRARVRAIALVLAAYGLACAVTAALGALGAPRPLPAPTILERFPEIGYLLQPWKYIAYLARNSILVAPSPLAAGAAHAADLANLALLLLPALVVSLIALRCTRGGAAGAADTTRSAAFDHGFYRALLVPAALLVAFFAPALGAAKDSDLYALPAFLAAVWAGDRLAVAAARGRLRQHTLAAIAIIALVQSALWIRLFQDREAARDWIWARVRDRAHQVAVLVPPELVGIGVELADAGRPEEAAEAYLMAYAGSGDPDHRGSAVHLLTAAGTEAAKKDDRAAAEHLFRRALAIDDSLAIARNALGVLLAEDGRLEEALAELRRAAREAPQQVEVLRNYGETLSRILNAGGARSPAARRALAAELDEVRERAAALAPGAPWLAAWPR